MFSVLQNIQNIKFNAIPYPYLVIDDALPKDYYEMLEKEFPDFNKIIESDRSLNEYKENTAYRYSAAQSLKDQNISSNWKDFISYHTSEKFFEDFYQNFKDPIKKIYNVGRDKLPSKEKIGTRFLGKHYFNTDCQFVINTPTSGETSVIEPHLDNPMEFYAALLYMKDPNDDSKGGNLTTYKFKDKPSFYGKSRVREYNVNLLEEIEYKPNRLVMFLNSPFSIHGVTKREKTSFYRKYMNIIGEFNFELFNYRQFLEK